MLAVLAVLSASLALSEDFKLINGKIYKNATISRIEVDGIVFRTKTGISKVYFVELPKDVQDRFHYGPAMPVAKQHQHEAIKLEGKQDGPSQADASGWTGGQRRWGSGYFHNSLRYQNRYHCRRCICYRSYSFPTTKERREQVTELIIDGTRVKVL
jgi:hypothetical protein